MNKLDTPAAVTAQVRRHHAYRLLWRWHFYAGLGCLPFVLWLSTTGLIYLFKPQLEPLLEQRYAQVAQPGAPLPPSTLVAKAIAAVPGSTLNAYQLAQGPHDAAQILVGHGKDLHRVYLDPSSGQVLHNVRENDRFMRVIFYLHGELMLGERGSMVVELAASWTIVLLLSGLYLWWPRSTRLAGVLYPRLRQGTRIALRDLHAVTAMWISVLALFLLVSGLPWSKSWGGMLAQLRQYHADTPRRQDWTISSDAEKAKWQAMNSAPDAQPTSAMDSMPGMNMPAADTVARPLAAHADYRALDRLLPVVDALRLQAPVTISPPSRLDAHWNAHAQPQDRSQRVDLELDGERAQVLSRIDFAQRPWLDRVIGYGVAIHEGQLFAPLNQILSVLTALGLQLMAISAALSWWRRRPSSMLGAPPPPLDRRYPLALVGALMLLGVLLPLLGLSMLAVLLIERWWLRRWPAARQFLGLGA
ncbi:MAG: PepSY domain-containing protein [Dyella sp.]